MQRSASERIVQTLAFETGGLVLAVPLYNAVFGRDETSGLLLLAAISIAVLIWTPLHNALFDRIEHRLTGRSASDRPHLLRGLHAISHEITPISVTLPLTMILGGHGLSEALSVNVGLTVLYVAYAYAFYLLYDRLRPLPTELPA